LLDSLLQEVGDNNGERRKNNKSYKQKI